MGQQFQVPQFIEREARLIGPLTLKQSALLGGTGAFLFVLWFMLENWLFFIVGVPVALIILLLGFLKINGRPLLDFATAFFSFFISPQIYIWQKRSVQQERPRRAKNAVEKFSGPATKITNQGIRDLAKKLDAGFPQ